MQKSEQDIKYELRKIAKELKTLNLILMAIEKNTNPTRLMFQ